MIVTGLLTVICPDTVPFWPEVDVEVGGEVGVDVAVGVEFPFGVGVDVAVSVGSPVEVAVGRVNQVYVPTICPKTAVSAA